MDMDVKTFDDLSELWLQYSGSKDPELKNRILTAYIPLVKKIVRRIMPKYKMYNDSEDLISCGMIGLIDAVDKYDINYGVKFETYATTRIRGEILDYMRKQDWAPSSLRTKINRINHASEALEYKLGRQPTEKEVAEYLHMPGAEYQKVMEKTHIFNLMYFEDMVTDTYFSDKMSDSDESNPAVILQNKEMNRILAELIDALPEKEKLVIALYYYEEMTLKEIAGILKVTESRVSQIHSKVLSRIGYKLKKMI
ncbi:sigma-70 family RNA polymerase sigma factor [Papillibacter cinnamivorans]|uniref:RNA polymerase sigma factor n=1 Tax=Papillibacter cinnamivorans DSM 12816 TaxID=1122930 RepID=A0A1W1YH60_9FIRM|nr:FliA/WhiG family RNA polymerase sigma factor [Papillibacter cinnamivorans]SMC35474.1 RNA polymerase, sigma 28 subunit, SigD/FliA/WhiG [Papillibacter cinnamivorans DSM 12816]